MDKQAAIDTVNKFLGLLLSDFDACTQMMSDDLVWENDLPPRVPFGGRYDGVAGLKHYFEQMSPTWTIGELVFHDFIYDSGSGTLAATGVEKGGTAIATGRSCDMAFIWTFRFASDGNLAHLREYNDTAAIGGTFDP